MKSLGPRSAAVGRVRGHSEPGQLQRGLRERAVGAARRHSGGWFALRPPERESAISLHGASPVLWSVKRLAQSSASSRADRRDPGPGPAKDAGWQLDKL